MTDLETAVAAVRGLVDLDRAEAWFTAVCDAHDEAGDDWAAIKVALADVAAQRSFDAATVEAFVTVVETDVANPLDVLREFAEHRDALPQLFADLATGEPQAAEQPDDGTDWDDETAAQWYRYLTQENNWAGWVGGGEREHDEAVWTEFSDWFLQFAEQAQVRPQAQRWLARVADDPAGPSAALAKIGIETAQADAQAAAEPEESDGWGEHTAAWYEELTTNKGWGGWSGAEEDWPEFAQRFGQHAESDGVAAHARHFLDEVAASTDKVAAFAGFGITIGAASGEPGEPGESVPEVLARIETEAAAEILAAAAGELPDDVPQEDLDRLLTQLLRERVLARG